MRKEILQLIKDYCIKEGNGTGGSLHIVLDDGNIEDYNIEFCIKFAKKEKDKDGIEIGKILLNLSKTQRKKVLIKFWKGWNY